MSTPQTLSLNGDDWTVYWLDPGEWRARAVWEGAAPEAAERRLPATVPGHVQSALLRAGELPDPYVGLNAEQWQWTWQRDWVYEKSFPVPPDLDGMRLFLRFGGIDGPAHVYLNGEHLGDHERRLLPVEWEVTSGVRPGEENRLTVVVEAPPLEWRADPQSFYYWWGPSFFYGDETILGLIPVGLWGDVTLTATGPARFRSVTPYTNVSIDRTEAAVSMVCEFDVAAPMRVAVLTEITQETLPVVEVEDAATLFDSGTIVVQSATIKRVQLWWPNGHGRQPLYTARVSLFDDRDNLLDERTFQFGVREVNAVPCEGAPPDSLPYGLEVNGRRVWIKGWIWTPLDYLYGSIPEERYERCLGLAKAAGVNLLRVWGGGLIEKEVFYRLCDRFGIMVWQDFPLAGRIEEGGMPFPAPLPSAPRFVEAVREHAEAAVAMRRTHPSLVLWCGGDRLLDPEARPLGSDHPALAELKAMVQTEDPQRLWLPASPSGPWAWALEAPPGEMHDVHDPLCWMGAKAHPHLINQLDPLLHGAVGCEGASDAETIRFIFGGDPPLPGASNDVDDVWLRRGGDGGSANLFGKITDRPAYERAIEDLPAHIRASQQLQAMGLQYGLEAARRRKWRCAGVIAWKLNESAPETAGNSAFDYFGRVKPAYYAVKRAYRPFHVSAAFQTFDWKGEAQFTADIWLHNSGEERSLLNVVATVVDLEGRELYQENLAGEAPAASAENVGDLSWRFPAGFAGVFLLLLEVIDEEGETIARNAYWHSRAPEPVFTPFLSAPATTLELERTHAGIAVRNTGGAVALGVRIEAGETLVEDSDFPLVPGACREIRLSDPAAPVTVGAWNASDIQS